MSRALALRTSKAPFQVIDVADPLYTGTNQPIGTQNYEAFLAQGDPEFDWDLPANEWDAIALNYTSGTTGNPKGVVYHRRGAARSEEHTSELQSLMRSSYAVFCLKKKKT